MTGNNKVNLNKDMKILIVDDFEMVRSIVRKFMTELGYSDMTEAENGAVALSKLKQDNYDFLITDWNMPEMNGLDLLKEVRSTESLQHIPVLMITAEAKRQQIIEAAQAGVNGYIVKPFNKADLEEKLNKIYARYNVSGIN